MDKQTLFDRFILMLNNIKSLHGLENIHDALILWFGENCLFLDVDDIKSNIVNDMHAEGVDAIFFDNNNTNIYFIQAKTVSSFNKTSDNLGENDLKKTLDGIRFLIKGDYIGKISQRLEELVNEYHAKEGNVGIKVSVYFGILKELLNIMKMIF